MEKLKSFFTKHKEIILYLIFGVFTTVVDFAVYYPLSLLAPDKPAVATAAKAIAWVAAVIFAFVTNKLFVFEDKRWNKKLVAQQAVSFLAARIMTLALSLLITYFGMQLLQSWKWYMSVDLLASYANVVIWVIQSALTIVLNYILSKLWIFKKNKKDKQTTQ